MSKEQVEALVEEAKRLAHKMMRDSWACGNAAAWQPARAELHAAIDALAALASPAAEPVPQPEARCATCGGSGWLGGPTYYSPDEGGESCPDCESQPVAAEPVQALTDEQILAIAANPMSAPCSPWWLKGEVMCGDVRNAALVFARAVLAASPPAAKEAKAGWQPIETAPQGESVYVSDGVYVCIAAWVDIPFKEYRDSDGFYVGQQDADAYWMRVSDGERIEPTLWMPPPAPEGAA